MAIPIITSEKGSDRVPKLFEIHVFMKRNLPRIGGSTGGFIALVVCLSLIIVVSCTAVAYLLWDRTASSDAEQAHRRQRSFYHHPLTTNTSSYAYNSSSRPSTPTRWFRFFGFRGSKDTNQTGTNSARMKMGRGGERGWVQAGSGDEWESDPGDQNRQERTTEPVVVREIAGQGQRPPTACSAPLVACPAPTSRNTSESTLNVRFDLQSARNVASPNRFSPSPQLTLPNIHSQLSSPSQSPAPSPVLGRTLSPEPLPGIAPESQSRPSMQRGVSLRTFEGGTKFVEGL